MPKKVLIALPPSMLEQVDFVAHVEHRTRSDMIREALRRYLDNFKRNQTNQIAMISFDETHQRVDTDIR
ncbi:MAG TPA: ribbon-helix-helix domain-containing protein [Oculatellaceae cyanobacterium]